ncbi:MAG: DUF3035 domain-containing protein [Alphaproteobacteria bacterium]|nr:DUF3035 domain-containing protein [Alphaproteobacteria bacterium]
MKHAAIISLGLVMALAGCGASEALGLGRNAPDEFSVVDRPPLSLPPDFSLRPPQPGAPRPQEVDMTKRASAVVFGSESKLEGGEQSGAEKALLEGAGAAKAEAGIRDIVDREASQKVAGSEHLVDELLWWRTKQPPAATVDAVAEKERLKEVKEQGEPVNKGPTPVIEKQKRGLLGL